MLRKKLKKLINPDKLDDREYLEKIFVLFLNLEDGLRKFTQYLDIKEVPQGCIDTNDNNSRHFFYYLYVLNCSGGMRLVKPYLDKVKVHTMLEFRFLAGMFFYNLDFESATSNYQKSLELVKGDFDEFKHKFIIGNLAASLVYTKRYEDYEELKGHSLDKSSNAPSINRLFMLYDIVKHLQVNEYDKAKVVYQKCFDKMLFDDGLTPGNILFYKVIKSSIERDSSSFRENLRILFQERKNKIHNFEKNPERCFSVLAYLVETSGFSKEVYEDIIDFEKITYPMDPFKVFDKTFDFNLIKSVGRKNAPNYINLETEEYEINGTKGILLKNEIKALYFLVRAGEFGLSFETLASLIYPVTDYNALFLLKDRMKQIVHRLKKIYKINIVTKKFRAYIPEKERNCFYLQSEGSLRLPGEFNLPTLWTTLKFPIASAKKVVIELEAKGILKKKLVGRQNSFIQLK